MAQLASLQSTWRALLRISAQCSAKTKCDTQQHLYYGTQNLLDLNTMIHLPPTTPLLAGGDRRGPKSLVHVSWYGLLHVVAEGNHTHFHCSKVMMLSAYKVYPVISMLPSLMAWFSRTVSNAARSAASACRTSQLFIEALASSSGWVRSRTRCRKSWL